VLVEPIAGNMGVIAPVDGFLEAMRSLCDTHGALLILDEVMTGFRVGRGGAQGLYGVSPDLTTLGKVLGGGMPVGAYGGSAALMQRIAPAGDVYQAGTLAGNPVTMAAGLATLRALDDAAYAKLEERSARLEAGLREVLSRRGVRGTVQRVASMLTLFFGVDSVHNFADAKAADHDRFRTFFHKMLAAGVYLPPSGYECWFVSLAHTAADIDRTIAAVDSALT